ncbi:MAG: 3,5-dihydroxyphenylacetyl-CoA synthase DpgA [Gemmatimonadaceae bacterium]
MGHLTGAFTPPAVSPPQILGVGTAVPPNSYSQAELLDMFLVKDRRARSVFLNGGIERRHLCLPAADPVNGLRVESQGELLKKHVDVGLAIGRECIEACFRETGASLADVRFLCCVSSTGYIVPGFSALLIKDLGIPCSCSRLDVVGMGCNAGLNALAAVSAWAQSHPGELALMVCIEVCSAMYVFDTTIETAVVNSLFGDGAAALALMAPSAVSVEGPRLLRFSSHMIPEAIRAMRVDWREGDGKFSFFLDPDVPYVVGANVEQAIERLLDGTGLHRTDIGHWIVHSGGRKVIDAIRVNLGLTRDDVRHTLDVLRDFGNVSSASFLFSYERFVAERRAAPGDYGILMAMGPGSTIEAALAAW